MIRGYRATLDRAGVGLELTAFVSLRIEGHHDERTTAVQDAIRAIELRVKQREQADLKALQAAQEAFAREHGLALE